MKKGLIFIVFILFAQQCFAQIPIKFNYQAVVRNALGTIVANKSVSFRVAITNGLNGAVEYSETHKSTTNAYGLVTLLIGGGTPLVGDISQVTWANGNKFIQTELDINGATNYKLMGSTQLLSVPFALVALSTPPSFYSAWGEYQSFNINRGT